MAGGKTQKLKKRMETVANAEKITNAMGLVATARLGGAKEKIQRSRPYFEILHDTLSDIVESSNGFSSVYQQEVPVNHTGIIVVGADRGMAGNFNNALFQTVKQLADSKNVILFPIGRKTMEFSISNEYSIFTDQYISADHLSVADCFDISKLLCSGFLEHNFEQLFLVYTHFTSMLDQTPISLPILPLSRSLDELAEPKKRKQILYEPSGEKVYDAIVPEYIAGMLYGSLCESRAAELSARHNAMDTASKNAQEMSDKLHLLYNRERQGQITQEITEIIAGAGVL